MTMRIVSSGNCIIAALLDMSICESVAILPYNI